MFKLCLLLCFISNIFSYDDFAYTIRVSEHNVTIKEPIIIDLDLQQKKQNTVMSFDFVLPKSDLYEVHLIDSVERKDSKGRVKITDKYLLYPLKSGTLTIKAYIIVKKASQEELKKFVTGSADELMYMRTKNKKIPLDPIILTVHKLEKEVALIGDYKLICKTDKEHVLADAQVNMECVLSGKGYKPALTGLFTSLKGMDVFKDINREDKQLFHKITFDYALSADADFTIPKIALDGYNPYQKKYYTLDIPAKSIEVERRALIDKREINAETSYPYKTYFNYLLLFIAGYWSQRFLRSVVQHDLGDAVKFGSRVKQCKSAKELLQYLLTQDVKRYQQEIEALEQIVYHDSPLSFRKIKKELS